MTQTPPDLRAALVQLREKWEAERVLLRDESGGLCRLLKAYQARDFVADLDALLALDHPSGEKRKGHRRKIERRAPKRGVTVRHDDERPDDVKRIRRGRPLPPPPVEPQ